LFEFAIVRTLTKKIKFQLNYMASIPYTSNIASLEQPRI